MSERPTNAEKPAGRRLSTWLIGVPVGLAVYIGVAAYLRHGQELPAWAAFTWPAIALAVFWIWLEVETRKDKKK